MFGHLLYFGKGGTTLEIDREIEKSLFPLEYDEVEYLVKKLKAFSLWKGYRNQDGLDIPSFINEILKLNDLVDTHPEIKELDINPIIGIGNNFQIVDSRIMV
jgi:acetyltransferase